MTSVNEVEVRPHDSLWRIARSHHTTVKEILALNPQIKSPDTLAVGDRIKVPGDTMDFTLRLVNMVDRPPVGVKYQIQHDKKILAAGKVTERDNEVSFPVRVGAKLELLAQRIGDNVLQAAGHIVVDSKRPLMLLRLNSAKLPSGTDLHPKSPPPGAKPPEKKAPPPASGKKNDQGVDHSKSKNDAAQPEHILLPGDCACGKDLTIDQLVAVFSSRKKDALEKFLSPLNTMFKAYAIDSCLRKSHALAQIGHESGSLRYTAEVLAKGVKEADVYDGYKGRGLIQLTYKKNYQKYGDYVGKNYLDENKSKLEEVDPATDSAGWYWNNGTASDLNPYADKNDLLYISSAINGAFNGFDDRLAVFKRAHKALLAPSCKVEANRSTDYLAFDKSAIYDKRDVAFAWGLWSDDKSSKEGLTKNADHAKAGYKRFLELNETTPIKKPRFGFKKKEDMIKLATERSK
jgi:putative chitinase